MRSGRGLNTKELISLFNCCLQRQDVYFNESSKTQFWILISAVPVVQSTEITHIHPVVVLLLKKRLRGGRNWRRTRQERLRRMKRRNWNQQSTNGSRWRINLRGGLRTRKRRRAGKLIIPAIASIVQ